jgi:hypothetical protein
MTGKAGTKNFILQASPDKKHVFVCFSLDSTRPENYIGQLEVELRKKSRAGKVLLDLFASNGQSARRFFEVQFDGESLLWLGARVAKQGDIDSATLDFCRRFYSKRKVGLEKRSVLSKAAVYREFKGMSVV